MATIRCPSNVSSITFTTSGVKAVAGGQISGITPQEAGSLLGAGHVGLMKGGEWFGFRIENANIANGVCSFLAPPFVTSITMSATPYAVSGGRITGVPAADATILDNQGFDLVQG